MIMVLWRTNLGNDLTGGQFCNSHFTCHVHVVRLAYVVSVTNAINHYSQRKIFHCNCLFVEYEKGIIEVMLS